MNGIQESLMLDSALAVKVFTGIDQEEKTRRCPRCNNVKPLDDFHKSRKRYSGVAVYCKKCVSDYHVQYAILNKEKLLISSRNYYKNNKEHHREVCSDWNKRNPEKIKKHQQDWRVRNPEKNIEKIHRYYNANREKVLAYNRKYQKANPEKARQSVHKRDAIKQQTTIEEINIMEIFERDNWICQICQRQVEKNLKWPNAGFASLDHVIPLSRGGTHTKDNLQLAHLTCNLRASNLKKDKKLLRRVSIDGQDRIIQSISL